MNNFSRQAQLERILAATVYRQRLITIAIIAAVFAAIIVPIVYGVMSHLRYVERDTASSPLLNGVGFVSHVWHMSGKHTSQWMMRVQMDGLRSSDIAVNTPPKIGQRVSLRYRIGKSGALYVDRVVPLETRN